MPNWVTNKLIIEGQNSVGVMKGLLSIDEYEDYYFDFNKIIPIPEELNIIAGSLTNKCVELYLTYINPDIKYFGIENTDYTFFYKQKTLVNNGKRFGSFVDNLTSKEIDEIVKRNINGANLKDVNDLLEYGKKAIANIDKFGSMDWYDWSIRNWGTKWNSCHNIYDIENSPNEIVFDTAWGNVLELMTTLSTMFPNNEFNYIFAEEQIGIQTGNVGIKNGEIIYGAFFQDGSKEAYEQSFELLGEDLMEFYEFDENKQTYVYVDEEETLDEEEM